MKLSVFGDDPVIKHLVGILSHSIIDLCNRMQPSIFFNPMSEIFRGGRPGLFDDYWFSSLSHSLVSNPILFAPRGLAIPVFTYFLSKVFFFKGLSQKKGTSTSSCQPDFKL